MTSGALRIVKQTFLGAHAVDGEVLVPRRVWSVAISRDGQYILVGSEHDLRLLDRWGVMHFRYAHPRRDVDLPFTHVALSPDFDTGLAIQRTGEVYRLDFEFRGESGGVKVSMQEIRVFPNDIYSISFFPENGIITIGHFNERISLINLGGDLVWQIPTRGRTWAVAFGANGDVIYTGSSGAPHNVIGVVDTQNGKPMGGIQVDARVMSLSTSPHLPGVIAVLSTRYGSYVSAYSNRLSEQIWTFETGVGEYVTAMTTDIEHDMVVIGDGAGTLYVLEASSGRILSKTALSATILSLAIAGGRYIVAGLQDGYVVYLEYTSFTEGEWVL